MGQACANISPRGRRRRARSGVATLALGVAGALLLALSSADPLWRLGLLPLFWSGALGVLQARAKT